MNYYPMLYRIALNNEWYAEIHAMGLFIKGPNSYSRSIPFDPNIPDAYAAILNIISTLYHTSSLRSANGIQTIRDLRS